MLEALASSDGIGSTIVSKVHSRTRPSIDGIGEKSVKLDY